MSGLFTCPKCGGECDYSPCNCPPTLLRKLDDQAERAVSALVVMRQQRDALLEAVRCCDEALVDAHPTSMVRLAQKKIRAAVALVSP